jgi:hypothetical protein
MGHSAERKLTEPGDLPAAPDLAPEGGTWRSEPTPGAKVCAVRLDTVHLVHSGLAEGWEADQAEAFLAESAVLAVVAPEGAMRPRTLLPPDVESWIEMVRYLQRELWEGAPGLGTTVALVTADALWVYTRGAHRVSLSSADKGIEPHEVARHDAKGRLWKLEPRARWTIESRIEGETDPVWTARWRPALGIVPPRVEPAVEAAGAPAVGEAPETPATLVPAAPRRRGWLGRRLVYLRRRWRLDAGLRQSVLAIVCLGLAVFAVSRVPRAQMQEAGEWVGDVATGHYRVWVTSVPAGTKVLVDGRDTKQLTPTWVIVATGEHRIDASLGEYGTTSFSVMGGRGGRKTMHIALLGRLALGCADSTVTLSARMEGRKIGTLPAIVDSVPAGRRQVSFQGRDVTPWVEEVSVVAGQTTSFLARPERVPDNGVVIARAYRVGQEGLKDLPGAVLFLDGKKACVTPGKLVVSRGLHTARLVIGKESSPVQLLRVEGGGELYATAEFGRSPEPSVSDQLVGAVSLVKPPTVRATLQSQLPIQVSEMRLSVRRWGRDFQRVSMNLREAAGGPVGEGVLPLDGMPEGSSMDYFVTIKTIDGEEFVSEMRTVKIVR